MKATYYCYRQYDPPKLNFHFADESDNLTGREVIDVNEF